MQRSIPIWFLEAAIKNAVFISFAYTTAPRVQPFGSSDPRGKGHCGVESISGKYNCVICIYSVCSFMWLSGKVPKMEESFVFLKRLLCMKGKARSASCVWEEVLRGRALNVPIKITQNIISTWVIAACPLVLVSEFNGIIECMDSKRKKERKTTGWWFCCLWKWWRWCTHVWKTQRRVL